MQISVGDIVEGKITGITSFGVFVDLGEGKTGMVHISEIARTYVSDIKEHVKEGDVVKAKVMTVSEDGKISLSIKRATEPPKPAPRKRTEPAKSDSSFVWTAKAQESTSFEDMMNKFKQASDEKFSDLKKKNADLRRPAKRGTR
ncbi:MAG: S1 RNA-binding domain-containing protein [Clostridia bacterium]|nr:S1 RNA-binding domain-containing protein [Clostridia bacterium]